MGCIGFMPHWAESVEGRSALFTLGSMQKKPFLYTPFSELVMNIEEKIVERERLAGEVERLRRQDKQIVFTNGCFDILHVGHTRYLAEARALGDALVVGLNSDESVRAIKGPLRPLVSQDQRAEVLAALQCVDRVVLFDEPDPLSLIRIVHPDILVKGADWAVDRIVGSDWVARNGGRVERIEVVPDVSTTALIERIRDRFCG
jgi:D-beta-D-heptose 7-phosphate kinase/D-beta-D-heptose 1-phosphate adenosyltransferase